MAHPIRSSRVLAAIGGLIWLTAGSEPAAGKQGRGSASPGVETVAVDFQALGADGLPVADLAADEVTLRVDGRRRAVQSLRFVAIRNERGTEPAITPLDPPYGTNVLTDLVRPARTLVIVVEDESLQTGRERPMRAAVTMLMNGLTPRDRVAVVTMPHGGLRIDLTTDHDKVLRTFEQIVGHAPQNETADGAACRTRDTLHALTGLLEDLTGGEGPTTVLFFSMGLVGPSPMVLPPPGVAGQIQPVIGRCTVLPEVFAQVGAAAEAARANFYIAPPDTSPFTAPLLEGIENLAGVTAGTRLGLGSGAETALARVARETSGYYLAAFAPEPAERDGLNHRVDVRVARTGVSVRTRPGFRIAKPLERLASAPAVTARELLHQGRLHRELPLRVAAFASRNPGDAGLRIVALAEPIESDATLTTAAVGLINASGKLVAQWSAVQADLAARPLRAGLVAPAGLYRVRVAATDAIGRRGTADYELDASLTTAGPLQLSSLVVGLSRAGQFVPRLEFHGEASAMAHLEVYGGAAGTPVGALLEVSDSPNGKPLLAVRLILEATNEPDRFSAVGTIPIGALPPGDFVARAIVEVQGQPAGRVIRTFRKVVR
jgi:VWFA-related protein